MEFIYYSIMNKQTLFLNCFSMNYLFSDLLDQIKNCLIIFIQSTLSKIFSIFVQELIFTLLAHYSHYYFAFQSNLDFQNWSFLINFINFICFNLMISCLKEYLQLITGYFKCLCYFIICFNSFYSLQIQFLVNLTLQKNEFLYPLLFHWRTIIKYFLSFFLISNYFIHAFLSFTSDLLLTNFDFLYFIQSLINIIDYLTPRFFFGNSPIIEGALLLMISLRVIVKFNCPLALFNLFFPNSWLFDILYRIILKLRVS